MLRIVAADAQDLRWSRAFGGWHEMHGYVSSLALWNIESAVAADGKWRIQSSNYYLKRSLPLVFDLELFARPRIDLHGPETQVARNAQRSERRRRSRSRCRRLSRSGRSCLSRSRRRGWSRGIGHGRRRA